jgi:hypothetical protein
MSIKSIIALLVVAFSIQPGSQMSTPVQVDLVFPQNNTVYQPVYPFPLLFAIHNFSIAWTYRPTLRWTLSKIRPDTVPGDVQGGFIGWDDKKIQVDWAPPADNFLAINSSEAPSQYNESSWILKYRLFMDTAECLNDTYIAGSIRFNTSRSSGIMPDFQAAEPCAPVLGSISLEGRTPGPDSCLQLTSPQPAPVSCAFKMESAAVDQISKVMKSHSECKNVTWPNTREEAHRECYDNNRKNAEAGGSSMPWGSLVLGLLITVLVTGSSIR